MIKTCFAQYHSQVELTKWKNNMSRLHERTQNNNTTVIALMDKKNPNDDI